MTGIAYLLVDWGTSSLRLWAMDNRGQVIQAARGDEGMSRLSPHEFEPVLRRYMARLGVDDTTPILACGMVGAAQGWHMAPYLDLPVNVDALAKSAVRVPDTQLDIRIMPGTALRETGAWDVVRGEETILLGAILSQGLDGLACLPGTHSKWIKVEGGQITAHSTAMTGELFEILSKHTTLSAFLDAPADKDQEFEASLRKVLKDPACFLTALFSIRAMPLLNGADAAALQPSRLSGLLIGAEIAGVLADGVDRVTLISSGPLSDKYAYALRIAGIETDSLDAEALVRAGLTHAAKAIWPNRWKGN